MSPDHNEGGFSPGGTGEVCREGEQARWYPPHTPQQRPTIVSPQWVSSQRLDHVIAALSDTNKKMRRPAAVAGTAASPVGSSPAAARLPVRTSIPLRGQCKWTPSHAKSPVAPGRARQ